MGQEVACAGGPWPGILWVHETPEPPFQGEGGGLVGWLGRHEAYCHVQFASAKRFPPSGFNQASSQADLSSPFHTRNRTLGPTKLIDPTRFTLALLLAGLSLGRWWRAAAPGWSSWPPQRRGKLGGPGVGRGGGEAGWKLQAVFFLFLLSFLAVRFWLWLGL